MGSIWRIAILSVCLCALVAPALRGAPSPQIDDTSSKDADWAELNSSMAKMHAAMAAIKPSGENDADFVRLMLPHHEAAIAMAKTQLLYGSDPQMRRLAQEIITDQESEIELMRLWLTHQESKTK